MRYSRAQYLKVINWIKRRVYWVVLFTICTVAVGVQFNECYLNYLTPEIQNLIMNDPEAKSPLPAFTFCYMMPYDISKLKDFGIRYDETEPLMSRRSPPLWKFEEKTRIDNFGLLMTGAVSNFTIEPYNIVKDRVEYYEKYYAKYGKCVTYTFKDKNRDITKVGFTFIAPPEHRDIILTEQKAFIKKMEHNETTNYKLSYLRMDGWLVYVHNKKEPWNELSMRATYRENFKLIMDEVVSININTNHYSLVSNEQFPCVDNKTYSKIICSSICRSERLAQRFNCTGPFMFPQPNYPECTDPTVIKNMLLLMMNSIRANKELKCACPRGCTILDYALTITARNNYPQPLHSTRPVISKLAVKFNRDNVQSIIESFNYDFNTLIADMGGSFGLFMGLSVISIAVPMKVLYDVCLRRCCRKYVYFKLEGHGDEEKGERFEKNGKVDAKHLMRIDKLNSAELREMRQPMQYVVYLPKGRSW